jgi:putative iron-dependent peroxidase
MSTNQPGIIADVPAHARYLSFRLQPEADVHATLRSLGRIDIDEGIVAGIGSLAVSAVGRGVAGLREFPRLVGPGVVVPSTPAALWVWLRGDDRGEILHLGRRVVAALGDGVAVDVALDAFRFAGGRDLTGYEDGTENPKGDDAPAAAFVSGAGAGMDGSSFVAVQRWLHSLDHFQALDSPEQDNIIGRRRSDNEELADAPPSAHVKRTEQESFEPKAFVLRRSMPWADGSGEGLVFVAFGKSFDAFEAQLQRMVGQEDGVTDALFRFSRPLTGSYFWCPPVSGGRLDLSAIGF